MSRAARTTCAHTRHRLQQLPQSALPEVPGRGGEGVARRARSRAAAGRRTSTSSTRCPAPIARHRLSEQGASIYDILFKASAETTITIAADPKHLGARIGITAVLHTWGSAMTHHPHVHMIVPGGGLSDDGSRWVRCRPSFFLPVRVLSRLFRRLFLADACRGARRRPTAFSGAHAALADTEAFAAFLAPLRRVEWVVYSRSRSADPRRFCAICRATRIASRSPIAG